MTQRRHCPGFSKASPHHLASMEVASIASIEARWWRPLRNRLDWQLPTTAKPQILSVFFCSGAGHAAACALYASEQDTSAGLHACLILVQHNGDVIGHAGMHHKMLCAATSGCKMYPLTIAEIPHLLCHWVVTGSLIRQVCSDAP